MCQHTDTSTCKHFTPVTLTINAASVCVRMCKVKTNKFPCLGMNEKCTTSMCDTTIESTARQHLFLVRVLRFLLVQRRPLRL